MKQQPTHPSRFTVEQNGDGMAIWYQPRPDQGTPFSRRPFLQYLAGNPDPEAVLQKIADVLEQHLPERGAQS